MAGRIRGIAPPFVVAPPRGARVRTRLRVCDSDTAVLWELGSYLGALANADLAQRCSEGIHVDSQVGKQSRRLRKQKLTAGSTSRWAGAITRTSNDTWNLAWRNLEAQRSSLRARVKKIASRLALPVGQGRGRTRGYATQAERFESQRRLQVLRSRLDEVEARLAEGRVSVTRGGKALWCKTNRLDQAGMSQARWRREWEAQRLFICADGEADKTWGNETIRWHPVEGWVEIRLPDHLAHLANRPYCRYRLSCAVSFSHRGDEVAAQAASGAVRYDITTDSSSGRWYLDASWKIDAQAPGIDHLRQHRVLAIDLNKDHLAGWTLTPDGNPLGQPVTIPLGLAGRSSEHRDGLLRHAISRLIRAARANGCAAFVIENLDLDDARRLGRERQGRRPRRGRRGRTFRSMVAGIPTAKLRDRLSQMAYNAGLAVIAVDPAYTSRWGAQHWLAPLDTQFSSDVSGHHAAAVVIGRRGLGQRARHRARCDSIPPEDGQERATDPSEQPAPAGKPVGLSEQRTRKPGDRKTRERTRQGSKTRPAGRPAPGNQAHQDRSGAPAGPDSLPLSV